MLIFIGYYIRRKFSEIPVFQELQDNATQSKTQLRQLFQDDWKTIIKAALSFAGNNAAGYMVTGGFVLGYVTTVHGVTETHMLILVAAAATLWIVTTLFAGIISDRIGRRPTYLIGYGFQLVWAILGGAFAPTIAQYLVGTTGWIGSVGVYLGVRATISVIAVLTIKEPRGTPLTSEQEPSQKESEPVSTPEPQKAGVL